MITVKKLSAGSYSVGVAGIDVAVSRLRAGWIAQADWDRHCHSDPLPTKRKAVDEAYRMVDDRISYLTKRNW